MRFLSFLLGVLACATMTRAQEPSAPHIRVTGEVTLSVEPDHSQIDLGVVTQASTAKEASDANATKLDAVLKAMKAVVGAGGKIETTSYSIHPNYHRPQGRAEATIASYTATNVVRASGVAIDATGALIDAAIGAGANNVERLEFTVDDPQTHQSRALDAAAKQARAKADTLAAALELQILGILSVTEGSPTMVRPYAARAAMMQAEAAPTPVEAGAVDIYASVTLIVAVGAR
jgi:uncharacterized protein YggE